MWIGFAQMEVARRKEDNLKKIKRFIRTERADLIVFPEYCMGVDDKGINRRLVSSLAEPVDGPFVSGVLDVASSNGATVVLPIYEKAKEGVYNSALLIEKGKLRGAYRKVNLFDALGYRESEFFSNGEKAVTFDLKDWRFGLMICYDLRFPELARTLAHNGAEAILVPAGWFRGPNKEDNWITLLKSRAQENTVYMAGVGNCAKPFVGRSSLVAPDGVQELDLGVGERFMAVELEKERIGRTRKALPVLQQSRKASFWHESI
ncbi:MAG: carbon-nitrogen hydrolase family protein [Nitrososphaerota archaeon]|nr:carbon-nitrogen hydrolase family protein [Nitrososphaerota archaeon]